MAVVALILLARAERRGASLHAARPGGWSVLAFVILTAVANSAIFSSHYMRNVDRLPFYYQLSVYSGLRVSYLFSDGPLERDACEKGAAGLRAGRPIGRNRRMRFAHRAAFR